MMSATRGQLGTSMAFVRDLPVFEGEMVAGKYRIEKVLGRGGMGVVVVATHVDLDHEVAIKFVLPPAACSDDLLERSSRRFGGAFPRMAVHSGGWSWWS